MVEVGAHKRLQVGLFVTCLVDSMRILINFLFKNEEEILRLGGRADILESLGIAYKILKNLIYVFFAYDYIVIFSGGVLHGMVHDRADNLVE